jgi:hypothetical protein
MSARLTKDAWFQPGMEVTYEDRQYRVLKYHRNFLLRPIGGETWTQRDVFLRRNDALLEVSRGRIRPAPM